MSTATRLRRDSPGRHSRVPAPGEGQLPWTKENTVVIYGVALLAFCTLIGVFTGDLLGRVIGVSSNVGGVGIAMLLLIVVSNLSRTDFQLSPPTRTGVTFWSAMYIPIVVAMAASQNVRAAVSSGWMAIVAGAAAVAVGFAAVPLLSGVRADRGDGAR